MYNFQLHYCPAYGMKKTKKQKEKLYYKTCIFQIELITERLRFKKIFIYIYTYCRLLISGVGRSIFDLICLI